MLCNAEYFADKTARGSSGNRQRFYWTSFWPGGYRFCVSNTTRKSESLFALIASDLHAKAEWVYGGANQKQIIKALFTDGTFAMLSYRMMQWSRRHRIEPLAMVFNKLNAWFGRCIIGRGADFGPGLVLIHSDGIVINATVRGGANVKIEHQATIGAEKDASPTIGNGVFIGAGARVLGGITVGDGARIGANAVVISDVPAGATAVGVPAEMKTMTEETA